MPTFLHAADLHLDSPLAGLERYDGAPVDEIREASRRAFDNLVETAIDREVTPKLTGAFSQQVVNSLLTRATLCYVTAGGDEKRRFKAFVRAICSDERVVSTWGVEGTAEQEADWVSLIASEPSVAEGRRSKKRGAT